MSFFVKGYSECVGLNVFEMFRSIAVITLMYDVLPLDPRNVFKLAPEFSTWLMWSLRSSLLPI